MAKVAIIKPEGDVKVYTFDTWEEADEFAKNYYTGLSYADGRETLVEVSE